MSSKNETTTKNATVIFFRKAIYQHIKILYCDAETIMRRYNNVEVSQCVLFDREKTIGNYFPSR